jgi:hypothetical protein
LWDTSAKRETPRRAPLITKDIFTILGAFHIQAIPANIVVDIDHIVA